MIVHYGHDAPQAECTTLCDGLDVQVPTASAFARNNNSKQFLFVRESDIVKCNWISEPRVHLQQVGDTDSAAQ